jgi:hypothetical protein
MIHTPLVFSNSSSSSSSFKLRLLERSDSTMRAREIRVTRLHFSFNLYLKSIRAHADGFADSQPTLLMVCLVDLRLDVAEDAIQQTVHTRDDETCWGKK